MSPRLLSAALCGSLATLVVYLAHGCAPTGVEPRPIIGPRLGESTASVHGMAAVSPPDGPVQSFSVPFTHAPSGPAPGAAAQPANPQNPPTPPGTEGETVTPEPVPSDVPPPGDAGV